MPPREDSHRITEPHPLHLPDEDDPFGGHIPPMFRNVMGFHYQTPAKKSDSSPTRPARWVAMADVIDCIVYCRFLKIP
jgi:hypothetical protein